MKGIQVYDREQNEWVWCTGYIAMDDNTAKSSIKMLRQWAREDESGERYRLREGEIVPA
jgi:hypothetical protein